MKPPGGMLLRQGLETRLGPAEAADAYARILARVGEEPVTVLGEGERGVVYGLPSGKVLKVTSDEGELRAMNLLKGRKHPNIVQVFDVFRLELSSGGNLGVILREAVDGSLEAAGAYRDLDQMMFMAVHHAQDLYRVRIKKVPPRQALWEAMLSFAKELEDAEEDLKPWSRMLLPGIARAIEELQDLGIYMLDLKASNIGLINDDPVLFDISLASVPEDAPDLELGRGALVP